MVSRAPASGVLSVSIAGSELATADAYATAAFAMGEAAAAFTATIAPYQGLTILNDGHTVRSAGFPSVSPDP